MIMESREETVSMKDEVDNLSDVISLTYKVMADLNNLDVNSHMKTVKKIGVLMILYATIICVCIILHITFIPGYSNNSTPLYYGLNCTKRFPLTDDFFASVCKTKHTLKLDIRTEVGNGVILNIKQWIYLKRSVPFIDKEISKQMEN